MIAERIAWEFASVPVRDQLRIRRARSEHGPIRLHDFERRILDQRPRDHQTVADVLQALVDLNTCRPVAMHGICAIPITAIWEWCARKGLDADGTETWTRMIRDADDAYRAECAKRAATP